MLVRATDNHEFRLTFLFRKKLGAIRPFIQLKKKKKKKIFFGFVFGLGTKALMKLSERDTVLLTQQVGRKKNDSIQQLSYLRLSPLLIL